MSKPGRESASKSLPAFADDCKFHAGTRVTWPGLETRTSLGAAAVVVMVPGMALNNTGSVNDDIRSCMVVSPKRELWDC